MEELSATAFAKSSVVNHFVHQSLARRHVESIDNPKRDAEQDNMQRLNPTHQL
jgi:hypothetical protein